MSGSAGIALWDIMSNRKKGFKGKCLLETIPLFPKIPQEPQKQGSKGFKSQALETVLASIMTRLKNRFICHYYKSITVCIHYLKIRIKSIVK